MGNLSPNFSQTVYEFLPSGVIRASKEGKTGFGSSLAEAWHELANELTLQYFSVRKSLLD